jgi:hypothetical protein
MLVELAALVAEHLADQAGDHDLLGLDAERGGVEAGGLEQPRGEFVQLGRLLFDKGGEVELRLAEPSDLDQSGAGRADGGERRLEGVGESVEHGGAHLLALPRGLGPAFFLTGPAAFQGDGGEGSERVGGERIDRAAQIERSGEALAGAQHAQRNRGRGSGARFVAGAFLAVNAVEEGDAAKLPLGLGACAAAVGPAEGLVVDGDAFQQKFFADERGELRAGRLAEVELQGSAADGIELLHRFAPPPRLQGVALFPAGEPAHDQRADLEGGEGDEVAGRAEIEAEERGDDEVVQAGDADDRGQRGLAESAGLGDHDNGQQIKKAGGGEIEAQHEGAEGEQRDHPPGQGALREEAKPARRPRPCYAAAGRRAGGGRFLRGAAFVVGT